MAALLFEATFPPSPGYVETEVDGERVLVPLITNDPQEALADLQAQLEQEQAKNAAIVASQQFLEDCMVEMAAAVYA